MTVTRRGKRFPSCTQQIGEDLQQGVDAGCSDSAWEDKLKNARRSSITCISRNQWHGRCKDRRGETGVFIACGEFAHRRQCRLEKEVRANLHRMHFQVQVQEASTDHLPRGRYDLLGLAGSTSTLPSTTGAILHGLSRPLLPPPQLLLPVEKQIVPFSYFSHAEPLTGASPSAPYLPSRNEIACLIQKTSCSQPLYRCFTCLRHETVCVLWLRNVATTPEPRVRLESMDRAFQAEFSFSSKRAPLSLAFLVLRFRHARSMRTGPVSARGRWSFPFRRPCSRVVSLRLS